jgi:hypothetical protein
MSIEDSTTFKFLQINSPTINLRPIMPGMFWGDTVGQLDYCWGSCVAIPLASGHIFRIISIHPEEITPSALPGGWTNFYLFPESWGQIHNVTTGSTAAVDEAPGVAQQNMWIESANVVAPIPIPRAGFFTHITENYAGAPLYHHGCVFTVITTH